MPSNTKTVTLSILASLGIGAGVGFYTAAFNGFMTERFTSPHYQTAAQSHHFIVGITLGYGVLFTLGSIGMLLLKFRLGQGVRLFYPLAGIIAIAVASWFRMLGGSLGTLDCGSSCVDTVVPLSAEQLATKLVIGTLIAIYVVCSCIYIFIRRTGPAKPQTR